MDLTTFFHTIIMGIVEGLTEFLPISSTGHLILVGDLLNFLSHEKRAVFEIFIQMGAMLAVVWEYRKKIAHTFLSALHSEKERRLCINIIIAFIPAAFMGLLLSDVIKSVLFNPVAVASSFIIGGILILWAEKREHVIRVADVDDMSYLDALKVGLCQCAALIPGTSRSGATIIGGLLFGLSRKSATEFSFFLAIPTLSAASLYSLINERDALSLDDIGIFGLGFVVAFISAFIAVRGLLKFIATHTFIVFAWYRIIFGIIVLLTAYTGMVNWSA